MKRRIATIVTVATFNVAGLVSTGTCWSAAAPQSAGVSPALSVESAQAAESIIVRVEKDMDEFSRLGQSIGPVLPQDFHQRVKRIVEQSKTDRSDPAAAAAYHQERSELIATLAAALNESIGKRDAVSASLATLEQSITTAEGEVAALKSAAQAGETQTRDKLAQKQRALSSVAANAQKVVTSGTVLPSDVQEMLRDVDQDKEIAQQQAAAAAMLAREVAKSERRVSELKGEFVRRRSEMQRAMKWDVADRATLDILAKVGATQTEVAGIDAVLAMMRAREASDKRVAVDWGLRAGDAMGSEPATQRARNSADVLEIIRRNAPGATATAQREDQP